MSRRGYRRIDPAGGRVTVEVNGGSLDLPPGMSVLAALLQHPDVGTGDMPDWFCGIGQCQRCRVRVNGREAIACQALVRPGDRIETQGDWSG